MKTLAILGSTGSIGRSTLAVVRNNPHSFRVHTLVANKNVDVMTEQCITFRPRYAVMSDKFAAIALQERLSEHRINIDVLSGEQAACQLVADNEVDQVMAAIVGAAGLLPTLAAIKASKQVLLANKESLVTCGRIFMQAVQQYGAQLLPVDSEHNAIYQSLPEVVQHQLGYANLAEHGIASILLTGSGGPFRTTDLSMLSTVTPDQACAHPNWSMGRKISVDSATMMNKGLEYIEARWLFNAAPHQMEIIIHPQSVIHSMVRYIDGSVIAQLGSPDMCTPIAYCMAYPQRILSGVVPLDFYQLSSLTFTVPDFERYPCLKLAIDASQSGQAATTALNAANEVAVDAFLNHNIKFTDIANINNEILQTLSCAEPETVEDVLEIDKWARCQASKRLSTYFSSR